MIDKILLFFGLVRVSRAKQIQAETVKLYARTMAQYAQDDFGVAPSLKLETESVKFSDDKFEMILAVWQPGVEIVGRWELKKT